MLVETLVFIQGLVFDYFINPENGDVVRWSDKVSFRMLYLRFDQAYLLVSPLP